MEKTYVSINYSGDWEDKEVNVVYVGSNYEKAKEIGIASSLVTEGRWKGNRDGNVGRVTIEHWVNEKLEKTEVIVT